MTQLYVETSKISTASIKTRAIQAAQAAQARFGNLAAYLPAYGKEYSLRSDRAGIHGNFYADGVTGAMIAPIPGSPLRFLDCDTAEAVALALKTIPRLAETLARRSCPQRVAFAFCAPNTLNWSRHYTDQSGVKHEFMSLRGPGYGLLWTGSLHVNRDGSPSGLEYTDNDQKIITLDRAEISALMALNINAAPPIKSTPLRKVDPGINSDPLSEVLHYLSYSAIAAQGNASRTNWVAVAGIIKDAGGTIEDFDRFSQTDPAKYAENKKGEIERVWKSLKGNKRATGGKLNAWDKSHNGGQATKDWFARCRGSEARSEPDRKTDKNFSQIVRDPEQNPTTPIPAPAQACLKISTPCDVSLGTLVHTLGYDPNRVLTLLPIEDTSRSTAYRRKSLTFSRCIGSDPEGAKNETDQALSQKRANRLRTLFPQGNLVEALIPIQKLTPGLFDDALTTEDIDRLVDSDELQAMTRYERDAIAGQLGNLDKIQRIERELAAVPFVMPDEPLRSVAGVRHHVLRQIVAHYTTTDPVTGEICCKLSNVVQACLLGVTTGALGSIRERGGIVQTAPPKVKKHYAKGVRVPVKARDKHYNSDGSVDAYEQPIARQHVVDLPIAPRIPRQKNAPATKVAPVGGVTSKPKPQKRRPPRQLYAAQLMRNILARFFKVQASADEPLDELARRIRQAIEPIATDVTVDRWAAAHSMTADEMLDRVLSTYPGEAAR